LLQGIRKLVRLFIKKSKTDVFDGIICFNESECEFLAPAGFTLLPGAGMADISVNN